MLNDPLSAKIINSYETKNLNKCAYLLIRGATYQGCKFPLNEYIAIIILDNVNKKYVDEFWDDSLTVEFWTFIRMRTWLKNKIQEKRNGLKSRNSFTNH